jgi:ribosomal protein S18 acetylase RimI-like enzyme
MPSMPDDPLIDAITAPAESLRLVAQCRDSMGAEGNLWADSFADRARSAIEDGSFTGRLWPGPGGEGVALAGWEVAGTLGRRGWVYLAEGYRRRTMLEGFLQRLEAPSNDRLPFISWADEIPGVLETDRQRVFAGRGLFPVIRADMRYPKSANPPRLAADPAYPPRTLGLTDEPRIADLLYRVYADSPERALFATTLDQREDARRGTYGLLHGDVGRWLPEASFGIQEGDRLVAHTLANELAGGLVTEVGVDPAYRRRGFARRLLPLTIDALRSAGFEVPRLVVSLWNPGAVRLYERMGFEPAPGGSSRVWLNLSVLGVKLPSRSKD